MKNSDVRKEDKAYLIGMTGQNMIYAVMSTGLSFYFQSVIFLPAMAISIITIISKIIEFISDPVMGYCIDITNTRYGKCRPYLMWSPVPICICSLFVFINFQYSAGNSLSKNVFIILWAGISCIIFGVVYSIGDVSLWSFPSLIKNNSSDRNKLLANARVVSQISGSFIVLIVLQLSQLAGNAVSKSIGDNVKGLQLGTVIVCGSIIILGAALFQVTGACVKEKVSFNRQKTTLKNSFILMWKCEPFRLIMISGILRSPYMLVNTVQNALYIYYFGNNGQTPYIFYMILSGGFSMIGNLIASAVTPKLALKYKKSKLFISNNIIAASAYMGIFILYSVRPNNIADMAEFSLFTALFFILSFAMGIVFALQSFMIGDAVDYEQKKSNYRPDGLFFSGQSLLIKISTGISSVISGIIYTIVGFSADNISYVNDALYNGADFKSDPQFAGYRFALFFMLSVIPAVGALISIVPMKKYAQYEE